jgi:RNA polymerase sigma-70 factor (ECF subfamily)
LAVALVAARAYDLLAMEGRELSGVEAAALARPVVYCLVPRDLAARLHEPLRRHFAGDPSVEVVVERRGDERRRGSDRRVGGSTGVAGAGDRRRIRSAGGRRVADRRVPVAVVDFPALPRRARAHAGRIVMVERLEPSGLRVEDADTARLVGRIQAGDRDAFAILYLRYFDRIYGYLRIALGDPGEAEDAAQQVFLKVLDALPRYCYSRSPFRAWLFVIARNLVISHLRKHGRLDPVDPFELDRHRDRAADSEPGIDALEWVTDRDLLVFIERLPVAQRQVLVLRYMLDLTSAQVAEVLGRGVSDVTVLQSRALAFLRERLAAVGRRSERSGRIRMRTPFRHATVLRARRFALTP